MVVTDGKCLKQIPKTLVRLCLLSLICYELTMLKCVEGWTYHYSSDKMNWQNARKWCQDHYTDMVAIQNQEENVYLNEVIPHVRGYYWIGIRKINETWTWVGTNQTLSEEAENWAENEPNNGKSTEDCVEIYIKRDKESGKWNDETCMKQKTALCYTASCHASSCSGHSACIETINNYTCKCHEGFYGPKCENVVDCAAMEKPQKGFIDCSHPFGIFSYNSACDFSCEAGYKLNGSDRVQCTASKEWTSQSPVCEAIKCESLKTVAHRVLNCTHPIESLVYNSTCLLSCEEGFVLNTTGSLQCTASGKWSAETPTCKAVTCNPLTVLKKDFMNCSHPFEHFGYKSKCSFYCPEGHLSGSSTLECNSSGKWTAEIPICKEDSNTLKDYRNIGLAAASACLLSGLSFIIWLIRRLRKNKKFDMERCAEQFQNDHLDYRHLTVAVVGASILAASLIIYFFVEMSYEEKEASSRKFFYRANYPRGKLNWHIIQAISLVAISYEILSGNGGVNAWTYHYNITPNMNWDTARQWCRDHYTDMVAIQNQNEIKHLNDVLPSNPNYYWIGIRKINGGWTWVGTNMTLKKEAENWAPGEPNNKGRAQDCVEIYIKRSSHASKWNDEKCTKQKGALCFQASCTASSCTAWGECIETIGNYTCHCYPGFKGPRCEYAMECENLHPPYHGTMNCSHLFGPFQFNSSCDFGCDQGFVMAGSGLLQCQASGQWTTDSPTCQAVKCEVLNIPSHGSMDCAHPIEKFSYNSGCWFGCEEGFLLNGTNSTQCTSQGRWSAQTPACQAVKCEALNIPSHGSMDCAHPIEKFSYNSGCWFGCEEGFLLNGTNSTQCTSQGRWSAQTPVCQALKCESLKTPIRGVMNCSHPFGDYRFNSSCEIDCEEGFIMRGSDRLQCNASGLWTEPLPTCQAVKCEVLNIPSHGSMDCAHPIEKFSYNSGCWFGCEEGFLLNGTNSTQCTSQGRWSAQTPACQALKCETLMAPIRGVMNCSHPFGNYRFNSSCEMGCEEGFIMRGSDRLQCNASGLWTEPLPTCHAVKCEVLNIPSHGSMDCAHPIEKFSYNSGCWFGCEEGFLLNGTNSTQCTSQGRWSAQTPVCQALKCESLKTPIRGVMNCSHPFGDYRFNSSCEIGCEEGFIMRGSDRLQCNASGLWTEPLPTCQAVKCEALNIPSHGSMDCAHPIEKFSYNSGCWFGCEEGFLLNGTNSTQCTSQGRWSAQTPACQALKCETLMAPIRGVMNCSHPFGDYRFNSSCEIGCEEGFIMRGSDRLQCNASGLWTEPLPTCQAVKCEVLNIPSHGSMDCAHPIEKFSYNSGCWFGCEEGFLLNGTNSTQCTSQGRWSAQTPACQALKCESLKTPIRGVMNCSHPFGDYRFNSSCEMGCEEGFIMRGSDRLQCNASGLWTEPLPTCQAVKCEALNIPSHGSMDCAHPIEKFSYNSGCWFGCEEGFLLNGTNSTQCTSQGRWSAQTPVCQAVKCEALNIPSHGSMDCAHPIEKFSYNSGCWFGCEEGFLLNGTNSTQCTSQGQWSAHTPACQALKCETLMAPIRSVMNCSHPFGEYRFNSSCEMGCEEGFIMRGSDRLQCNASGLWTEPLPTCQVVECPPLPISSAVEMNCSHPIGHFSFLSSCYFSCAEGSKLNGTNRLHCTSDGQWTGTVPSCAALVMSTGMAMLLYTGVGSGAAVSLLLLGGIVFLIVKRLTRESDKQRLCPEGNSSVLGECANPAYDGI
ncbi:sushi, von Willebrand factor type A, EGF and pentraxin domain-containing protein 1-like [Acipenser ruthenus]|uniref:sushi, von Willebrand factor type A, EGF and pentraxin domain-containing protein 1-like n=1 Tax=Acipenser ruthenus TaxID=7906 RepID=UPI0027411F98|nr:sushi, von Willebrand factor type A, EGF and pentraxin domain-containing protein 1-like [Acipenser ruthenus]